MVARWLDINLPEHTTITTFKQSGYNLKVKREKQDKNNELDDKEKDNFKEYLKRRVAFLTSDVCDKDDSQFKEFLDITVNKSSP